MKIKTIFALAVFMLAGYISQAQSSELKIGYTNVDYILSLMPESKQIEADLTDHERQLTSQLQSKVQEFQQKMDAFQRGAETMTQLVREDKQEELRNMQASIERFQREADTSLQRKQAELLEPVYTKIQNAIDKVAKDKGYTYIFSSDAGGMPVLLHADESHNISDDVLTSLGITPPAKN